MNNVIPITRSIKRPRASLVARIVPVGQLKPTPRGFVVFEARGNIVAPIVAREGQLIGVDLSQTLSPMLAVSSADGRKVYRTIARGARHMDNIVRELCALSDSGALVLVHASDRELLMQFLRTGTIEANGARS